MLQITTFIRGGHLHNFGSKIPLPMLYMSGANFAEGELGSKTLLE